MTEKLEFSCEKTISQCAKSSRNMCTIEFTAAALRVNSKKWEKSCCWHVVPAEEYRLERRAIKRSN